MYKHFVVSVQTVVSIRACSALQRFQSLPAARSSQIISSCVITGSLAEFRTCLSGGLQLFRSLGRNIDVPFGRRFHPKPLTGPLHAFFSTTGPRRSQTSQTGWLNIIVNHEGHKKQPVPPSNLLTLPCYTLNLLSGNLAHRNKQPSGLRATANPERGRECRKEKWNEERGQLMRKEDRCVFGCSL